MSKKCQVVTGREPLTFCGKEKKSWQLACLDHWRAVPKPLQDEVWRQYKSARGSDGHMAAIHECYRFLNAPYPDARRSELTRAGGAGGQGQ